MTLIERYGFFLIINSISLVLEIRFNISLYWIDLTWFFTISFSFQNIGGLWVSTAVSISKFSDIILSWIFKSLFNFDKKVLNIIIQSSIAKLFSFRILLILLSSFLLKYLFLRIFAGLYLIYLFLDNSFFSNKDSEINNNNDINDKNILNKYKFFKVVILLSVTDFAFSIDSITTAVAISDQYFLIVIGATIGVIALRFTSEIFLRLLEYFIRLEMAGYIAILIIGIKLILNSLIMEIILPDYYFYILIFLSFIWGFSKQKT